MIGMYSDSNLKDILETLHQKFMKNPDFLTQLKAQYKAKLELQESQIQKINELLFECQQEGKGNFLDYIMQKVDDPILLMEILQQMDKLSKIINSPLENKTTLQVSKGLKPQTLEIMESQNKKANSQNFKRANQISGSTAEESPAQKRNNISQGSYQQRSTEQSIKSKDEELLLSDEEEVEKPQSHLKVFSKKILMQVATVFSPPQTQQTLRPESTKGPFSIWGFKVGSENPGQRRVKPTPKSSTNIVTISRDDEIRMERKQRDLEETKEKRRITRVAQITQQYQQEYGLQSGKVCFLFQDPMRFLEIPDSQVNQFPSFTNYPESKCIKSNLAIVKYKQGQYLCAGGYLHQEMLKGLISSIEQKMEIEVDLHVPLSDKESIDLCIKFRFDLSGKIKAKIRKVKSLLKHEYEKKNYELMAQKGVNSKPLDIIIKGWFKGPQLYEPSATSWKQLNGTLVQSQQLICNISDLRQKVKETQEDQINWIEINNEKLIVAQEYGKLPYILNPNKFTKQSVQKECQKKSKVFWDYVDTFSPPEKLRLEDKSNYVHKLNPTSFEYQYVAYKWASTLGGLEAHLSIKKAFKKFAEVGVPSQASQIVCIEKIHNSVLLKKTQKELERMQIKYKTHSVEEIVHHLFYGSGTTNPQSLYFTEDGFYTNKTNKEESEYLTESSHQANQYSYQSPQGKQVFLSLALIPPSHSMSSLFDMSKSSPNKSDSTSRNDSQSDKGSSFNIIDNITVYPGYLITYKQ